MSNQNRVGIPTPPRVRRIGAESTPGLSLLNFLMFQKEVKEMPHLFLCTVSEATKPAASSAFSGRLL